MYAAAHWTARDHFGDRLLAETVRFELTEGSPPRQFSRLLPSTARPRLRIAPIFARAGPRGRPHTRERRCGSERRVDGEPHAARLDRMEVEVVDAGGRLALQPRGVEVVDVARLAIEQVEDVERDADLRCDAVADAQVRERRRRRA